MSKFKVDFEYLVPEFSEVTLEALDADDAVAKADAEIMKIYPEAQEIEITLVTAL